jgi:hypothetical protein
MITVTVLDFLKQKLPDNYVLAIIQNMQVKEMLDEKSKGSLLYELEDLFDWQNSNEGYQFWADVFDAIQEGEPLPKLPFRAKWKPNTYICTESGSFIVNANDSGVDLNIELNLSEKPKHWEEKFFKEQHLSFVN